MLKNVDNPTKNITYSTTAKITDNKLFKIRKSETVGILLSCNTNVMLTISGRTIFEITIEHIAAIKEISSIIILIDNIYLERCSAIIRRMRITNIKKIIVKGPNINELFNDVNMYIKDWDFIILHDCARPFIDGNSIKELINATREFGYAFLISNNNNNLDEIETPQVFNYKILNEIILKEKLDERNIFDLSEFIHISDNKGIVRLNNNNIRVVSELEAKDAAKFLV